MVADPITKYHRDQTARTERLLSMASATGIPATVRGQSEEEPLLGGRGDASQPEGDRLVGNLWIGMCHLMIVEGRGRGLICVVVCRYSTDCASRNLDSRGNCLGRDF
jgi:hypothetical protein